MPNFSLWNTVATTTTLPNILAGSPFEFVGRDSRVAVAMGCTNYGAVNPAIGAVTTNITFGSELQVQNANLPATGGTAAQPQSARLPDHVVVDDVAAAGDRLVIELTNADAVTAAVCNTVVRILPI